MPILSLQNHEQTTIPAPTANRGIAADPFKADEMMKLLILRIIVCMLPRNADGIKLNQMKVIGRILYWQ